MKKANLFIFGILFLTTLMVSCHKGRNKLIGSWKVTNVEIKKPLSDSIKNEIIEKGELTFTEEGHVTGFLRRKITDGDFILSQGGKSLIIKDETGTPYPCESIITSDQLILDADEMKLTLKKL
ncbi:hypothetical protein [Flavobacterium adhaerens]|uniref:hypothetical protein n=1 Tax=Flavobacterium adhaerens TaxID=3149043 RepID=UPI0032B53DE8